MSHITTTIPVDIFYHKLVALSLIAVGKFRITTEQL